MKNSKLAEVVSVMAEKGKKKRKRSYEEIVDDLQGFQLGPDSIDDILEHLQSLGISVGNEAEAEDEGEPESVENEDIFVPDGIEIDVARVDQSLVHID